MSSHRSGRRSPGRVALVGAGPGDPQLLTLAAVEELKSADVVIHDRLVAKEILRLIPKGAKVIAARDHHDDDRSQERINRLMLLHAKKGRRVVRLKGGDPFLLGRGGEELEFLKGEGIEVKVIPGITSALAVPAYLGIPLTHREHSSSLAIATGHGARGKERDPVKWEALAKAVDTIVVLMGVGRLSEITTRLIKGGLSPSTPAALIQWGTLSEERSLLARLDRIAQAAQEEGLKPPAILVVGEVARLSMRLRWRRGQGDV